MLQKFFKFNTTGIKLVFIQRELLHLFKKCNKKWRKYFVTLLQDFENLTIFTSVFFSSFFLKLNSLKDNFLYLINYSLTRDSYFNFVTSFFIKTLVAFEIENFLHIFWQTSHCFIHISNLFDIYTIYLMYKETNYIQTGEIYLII